MKKIRLVDQTELEVYNLEENQGTLKIQMLDADLNEMQETFRDTENLAVIQYYVGTELMKAFAGYDRLASILAEENYLVSINYEETDPDTKSGFEEEHACLVTIKIEKPAAIELVADQTEQNTADIDYLMMKQDEEENVEG